MLCNMGRLRPSPEISESVNLDSHSELRDIDDRPKQQHQKLSSCAW